MDDVLTINDASKMLKLSVRTVYDLLRRGELPGRKVGGSWRLSRARLRAWLDNGGAGTTCASPGISEDS